MKTDNKKATSYRLSPDALRMVELLQDRYGISRASIIEMAIRELWRGTENKWGTAKRKG